MRTLRAGLIGLSLLIVGGCAQSPTIAQKSPPIRAANHAHFAPPPALNSEWDAELGVYKITQQPHIYYRQRTYYRHAGAWQWSTSMQGPWSACEQTEVPPALYRRYAH